MYPHIGDFCVSESYMTFKDVSISKILAVTTPCLDAGCMKYVLPSVVHKGPCRSLSWLQRTGEKRDAHILKI